MRRLGLALTAMLLLAGAGVPEPDGYRAPPYQAEVPATLQGASVIDTTEAQRLHAAGTPFIDVFPRTARPVGLPAGTLWREPVHDSIPGAMWLPGTGFEALAPPEEALLEAGLAEASRGDKAASMVVFCRSNCWLSWNAGRRAVALGYTGIRWYPAGADGWQAAGGALAPAQPFVPQDP